MPELIDREQAGKNICKYCASNAYCKEDDCMVYQGLRDTPTIQIEAEPVRHGRWIHCDVLDYKDPNGVIHVYGMCSRCRLIYDFRDMTSRFKFCPNCGAKMYADGGTISKERFAEIMRGDENA